MPFLNYIIGLVAAFCIFFVAKKYKMLNSNEFFFAILVTITTYYIVFAVEHNKYILTEILGSAIFVTLGLLFLRRSINILAILIVLHGVYDLFHAIVIPNSGTPIWWPGFCATFDIVLGVLFFTFVRNKKRGRDYV